MFFITHSETGNSSTAIVEIDGPLNSETSTDFEEYTSRLADNGLINIIINSAKINFISSEGIGAVLLLHRKISAMNGIVVFFGLSREISLLFQLLGFDTAINSSPDKETALEMVRAGVSGTRNNVTPRESVKRSMESRTDKPSAPATSVETPRDSHTPIRPFVIECVRCSSPVRVSMTGEHFCPYCSAPFTVSGEGNAIFRINDIPSPDRQESL